MKLTDYLSSPHDLFPAGYVLPGTQTLYLLLRASHRPTNYPEESRDGRAPLSDMDSLSGRGRSTALKASVPDGRGLSRGSHGHGCHGIKGGPRNRPVPGGFCVAFGRSKATNWRQRASEFRSLFLTEYFTPPNPGSGPGSGFGSAPWHDETVSGSVPRRLPGPGGRSVPGSRWP